MDCILNYSSQYKFLLPVLLFFLLFGVGCNKEVEEVDADYNVNNPTEQQHAENVNGVSGSGVVLSSLNTGNYSYIEFESNGKPFWLATVKMTVSPGSPIQFKGGQIMANFHSKSLNKDFPEIIFSNYVKVGMEKARQAGPPSAGMAGSVDHQKYQKQTSVPVVIEKGSIKKASGGFTVEELFSKKKQLVGKNVKIRGKIVKYTPGIMGKTWIHLRDGTGSAKTNDLTVTTTSNAKNGDTILVSGKLSLNRDFGQGYIYEVIIENANVTVE